MDDIKNVMRKRLSIQHRGKNMIGSITLNEIKSYLNMEKVEDMRFMFENSGVKKVNFKNCKTPSLLGMYNMFENCHNLTSIDLSMFNTSKVMDISEIFFGSENLE